MKAIRKTIITRIALMLRATVVKVRRTRRETAGGMQCASEAERGRYEHRNVEVVPAERYETLVFRGASVF